MNSTTKRTITVFGNAEEPQDNLAVKLLPELKRRFRMIDFRIEDPTESLEPSGDPWIIIDVAQGINEVTVIDKLKDLEGMRGSSAHDYDVYMELRLKEKLGQLPKLKIILVPSDGDEENFLEAVSSTISTQTSR
jgi:hypothetical protein